MIHGLVLSLLVAALVSACSVQKGMKKMEKNTEEMNDTTQEMNDTTSEMKTATDRMSEDTSEVRKATESMLAKTEKMAETTERMAETTSKMAETTSDMAATTTKMAETTTEMAETTGELKERSEAMLGEMRNLRAISRQGGSAAFVDEEFVRLVEEDDLFGKFRIAQKMLKGYEFQLWKSLNEEDQALIAEMKGSAVLDFMAVLTSLVEKDLGNHRSLSPASNHNAMQTLYALAAALHTTNPLGELNRDEGDGGSSDPFAKASVGPGQPGHEGLLTLIQEGLLAKAALEANTRTLDELAPHEKHVLEYESMAVYILQLRVNFLAGYAVKNLAVEDGQNFSFLQRLWLLARTWSPKTEKRNLAELEKFSDVLRLALETQTFLESLGRKAPLDGSLAKFLGRMRTGRTDLSAASDQRRDVVGKLEQQLQHLVK